MNMPTTIGPIGQHLGEPIHVVRHIIDTRKIPCVGTAGKYRLFDEAAVAMIRRELDVMRGRALRNPEPASA